MSAAKVQFARDAYASGCCPGCGAPLVKVAGIGTRHLMAGHEINIGSRSKSQGRVVHRRHGVPYVVSRAGDSTGGQISGDDPRLCPWSADDLAALVHIGSGLVGAP